MAWGEVRDLECREYEWERYKKEDALNPVRWRVGVEEIAARVG